MEGDKNLEALGCDANLMKNVWEIRLREYGQKRQTEDERKGKSALGSINKEWETRITSKNKYPKRLEKKPLPGEGVTSQMNRHMGPDPGFGFPGSQHQRDKKGVAKGSKLIRLLTLTEKQPVLIKWTKSWMFARQQPQMEEGMAQPSSWGKAWKFLNLQPHTEGKPWTEHDGANNVGHMEDLSLWEQVKSTRFLDSQQLQQSLPMPEWETSWKYTKPQSKQKSETKEGTSAGTHQANNRMFDRLVKSQHHNEELSSSEWNESWKSTKPPKGGVDHSDVSTYGEGKEPTHKQQNGKPTSQWGYDWKFMNCQLHVNGMPNQTSNHSEWVDSWKAATGVSNNNKKAKSPEHGERVHGEHVHGEHQESHLHKVIMFVSHEQKYRELWSSQLCDENKPLSEWDRSWTMTKNQSKSDAKKSMKGEEPKVDDYSKKEDMEEGMKVDVVHKTMNNNMLMSKTAKYKQLMSPLFFHDMPYEWNEAWKVPKPQPHKEKDKWTENGIPDVSMVLKRHMKKRSLTDWSESWKCARVHSRHGRPSVTEWNASWFSRFQPHAGREHWLYEAGLKDHALKHPKYELFHLPQRGKAAKMFDHMENMIKEMFPSEWKDSWKSLKHQLRTERMRTRPHRSRPFREPTREEHPTSEWAGSWRVTNLTLNQESGLWDQGWSNMPQFRMNRGTDHFYSMTEEVPHNGPTGGRGWNESWRSSRHQQHAEVKQPGPSSQRCDTQPHRGRRSTADWEKSWMVSNTQFHHDRPSMTEWANSWSSTFHTDNWGREEPKQNWYDRSMEIKPRKDKLQLSSSKQRISRTFDSLIFKERYPQTQWSESWKVATLQCHHQKKRYLMDDKFKSSCFHVTNTMVSISDWEQSWKLLNINFNQKKESWDAGWQNIQTTQVECQLSGNHMPHAMMPHMTSNNVSKWGKSWHIANPMPLIERGSWLDCSNNQSEYLVLWSRHKSINQLHVNFNNAAAFRLWGKSWKFLNIEGKGDSKSGKSKNKESKDRMEIISKKIKARKHIYSDIDKEKPSERKWADCHKLAKTQPRPKRDSWLKMTTDNTKSEEQGFEEEWAGSWRFSNGPMIQKKENPSVSLSGWEDSWKFLLAPYAPENRRT